MKIDGRVFLSVLLWKTAVLLAQPLCSYRAVDRNVTIRCEDVSPEEYLDRILEMRTIQIPRLLRHNETVISLELDRCRMSHVDDWIYLPWEESLEQVSALALTNSSVSGVRSLSKFRSLKYLDLSANNISDFSFLHRLRRLRRLDLAHTNFTPNSSLFAYLRKPMLELRFLNLSHCNLTNLTVPGGAAIEAYDLSHNADLAEIVFENSEYDTRPRLDVRGDGNLVRIANEQRDYFFVCLSEFRVDNSAGGHGLNGTLRNVRVSDVVSLRGSSIPFLNESSFNLTRLRFRWCSNVLGLSVDLSGVGMQDIEEGYFNGQSLNELDLSFNNLTRLERPLFDEARIHYLNLSRSNVRFVGPEVFANLTLGALDLSRNHIASLDGILARIVRIDALSLAYNPIASIGKNAFKKCRDLVMVDLSGVFASFEGKNLFAGMASLASLSLSFRGSLNASEIRNMHVVNLTIVDSKLDGLNSSTFEGFYKLTRLTFVGSSTPRINVDAFKGLYNVKQLKFKGLSVAEFEPKMFRTLPSLETLDLSGYNLKKLNTDLKGLSSLKVLNLSSNAVVLTADSFASLENLRWLSLADNKLSSLVIGLFSPLTRLTELYLQKNSLQQLTPGMFAGLDDLEVLDLSHNGLYRTKLHILVAVSARKLQYLYLQHNNLGSEYAHEDSNVRRNEFKLISTHASLRRIDINDNEWQCGTLIDLLINFRDRNISFVPSQPTYLSSNIDGISCT